ncbi:DUF3883 domain-containing protein [Autumnicola edwardsiae]|uniref:DUF3883 domain-containing protein n=1 Tax=Autumnicola edwardsiae TaxID=3075594 RepID=A0ABU3CW51_9FLAO|nr:DUF3883 domain-containing protein [Zunongwangia sp. F297]MDT0650580.1 DUF3883 domain-containing protein [Zunongwangia sp. F297]
MSNWSELEVNLIIQIYFEMLRKELSNRRYSKTEYRKNLLPLLNNRSEGAIEFKHQNISAALIKFNQPYIKGYLPRFNYQQILDEKVAAHLENHTDYEKLFKIYADRDVEKRSIDNYDKMLVKPPAIEEVNEPKISYTRNPIKVNYLEREQKNSKLGYLGEKLIYDYEKWNLTKMGKEKLAQEIRWISKDEGDGAGYDILSKTIDGQDKYIEVKTTKLGIKTPFFFSDNEFEFSNRNSKNYYLYRVFDFENRSRIFTKNGGLQEICQYAPVVYKGYF